MDRGRRLHGLVITGLAALISTRFGIAGATLSGIFVGLVPSIVVELWAWLARLGFEESAAEMGFALMLALPSAVGGGFAALIYAWRNRVPLNP